MIWWILLAGLVFGVLVLGLAAWPVLRRLRTLQRALRRLSERAVEAQRLQASAEALQQRVESVAGQAAAVQDRVAARREPASHGPVRQTPW